MTVSSHIFYLNKIAIITKTTQHIQNNKEEMTTYLYL